MGMAPVGPLMIESVQLKNFKVLRNARLPMGPFTLIVGPNGSGKSTALHALKLLSVQQGTTYQDLRTIGVPYPARVALVAEYRVRNVKYDVDVSWGPSNSPSVQLRPTGASIPEVENEIRNNLSRTQTFSLDAAAMTKPVPLQPNTQMSSNGDNMAVVLDTLRDRYPERFEELNNQLTRWLPEWDRILFETSNQGHRSISLRSRKDPSHVVRAADLSQGTLIAMALLTISFLPQPPLLIGLEEPDRGLHPRLLRDVRDALYHLTHPEGAGEKRDPVQVVATTHNPYFLDLFRDHPDEIVIAERTGLEAKFSRLSDRGDLDDILEDATLSEVWYSGVLGGVPSGT